MCVECDTVVQQNADTRGIVLTYGPLQLFVVKDAGVCNGYAPSVTSLCEMNFMLPALRRPGEILQQCSKHGHHYRVTIDFTKKTMSPLMKD